MIQKRNVLATRMVLFQLYSNNLMEEKSAWYPNRIEISEFGVTYLRQLPLQLNEMDVLPAQEKENVSILTPAFRKRGQGIDFHQFAQQTQSSIHRQLVAVMKGRGQVTAGDPRRKQQLHHQNWLNQQRLVKHKLQDVYTRIEQSKYSEYDWQRQSSALRGERASILSRWQTAHLTRDKRLLSKLKKIMERKYPGRSASCASGVRARHR